MRNKQQANTADKITKNILTYLAIRGLKLDNVIIAEIRSIVHQSLNSNKIPQLPQIEIKKKKKGPID